MPVRIDPSRGGMGHGEVWDDLPLLTVARATGALAPSLTAYRGGIYLFEFVGNAMRELHGSIELTHTYKEGLLRGTSRSLENKLLQRGGRHRSMGAGVHVGEASQWFS